MSSGSWNVQCLITSLMEAQEWRPSLLSVSMDKQDKLSPQNYSQESPKGHQSTILPVCRAVHIANAFLLCRSFQLPAASKICFIFFHDQTCSSAGVDYGKYLRPFKCCCTDGWRSLFIMDVVFTRVFNGHVAAWESEVLSDHLECLS